MVRNNQDRIKEWTQESSVKESIATQNLQHISDPKQIASLLGWKSYNHTPGWYILSCDPATGKTYKFGQFKPDTPITTPDGKQQKYITFPKGEKIDAIYLRITLDDWITISDQWGVEIKDEDIDESREDLGFWRWVLTNPAIPLFLTEGGKKAGSLLSANYPGICLTGVWNGQEGKGRKLIPSLQPFISRRAIYLTFDSDIVDKPGVASALKQLGHLCQREGATVRVVLWDEEQGKGKGCDDFITKNGKDEFTKIVNNALPYSVWVGMYEDENPQQSPRIQRTERYKAICSYLGLNPADCLNTEGKTFDQLVFERLFEKGQGQWRSKDHSFYRYEKGGYWKRVEDDRVYGSIADLSEKIYKLKNSKEFGWEEEYAFATNRHCESTFKFCRRRLFDVDETGDSVFRVFKNCTVDMRSGQVLAHTPDFFCTTAIDENYVPNRPCPPDFKKFITEAFGEDLVEHIRAYTSWLVDPTAPYGVFVHLLGPSGSGKGTLLRLWGSFFNQNQYRSGSSFEDLLKPEGRHQYLTGTAMFALPDVGGYVSGVRSFYELVDNGKMSGRALFNPEGYQKQWNCKFVIASVDHLQIENAGDGWERRVRVLPSQVRTRAEDPQLFNKLIAERADIISWALSMPREQRDELIMRGCSERMRDIKREAKIYGDAVRAFVDLCLKPSTTDAETPNYLLHSWFEAFCRQHGYQGSRNISTFISHLKTVLPNNRLERKYSPGGRTPATWKFLAPVEGVFEQETNSHNSETFWICRKSKCVGGGLREFEDFWNPPPAPPPISPEPTPPEPTPPPPTPKPALVSVSPQPAPAPLEPVQVKLPALPAPAPTEKFSFDGEGLKVLIEDLECAAQSRFSWDEIKIWVDLIDEPTMRKAWASLSEETKFYFHSIKPASPQPQPPPASPQPQPPPAPPPILDLSEGVVIGLGWENFPGPGSRQSKRNQAKQIAKQLKRGDPRILVQGHLADPAAISWVKEHLLKGERLPEPVDADQLGLFNG